MTREKKRKNKVNWHEIEKKWQDYWEKEKIYKFNKESKKPIYSIDTPPPYVSGEIHVGHAMSYSQFEFVARYKRMQGFEVFYPFGFDDNGLPTEKYVERTYGIKSKEVGRKKFVELCLKETDKGRKYYKEIYQRLGHSMDWNLTYSTIDSYCTKQAQKSFIELYNKKRIYRIKDPVIYCTNCKTALSQSELEDKEEESNLNDILFELDDKKKIIISTTRPEMLSSCVGIFVNPKDKKNNHLIGRKAIVPIFNQKVEIMGDEKVDINFGTGIVMICTFGDKTDVEWWRKHKLNLKISLNENGLMNELAGELNGLSIKEARKKIIEKLKEKGLLIKQKPIKHVVNVHESCGNPIEFIPTKQWFIKMLDLKEELLKQGEKINWFPKYMKIRYDHWVSGLQWDWCISRQRYYGVPFPVWYCTKCNKEIIADEEDLPIDPLKDKPKKECECGNKEFIPENDVMDTWMISSLTPQITCKWKEDKEFFKKMMPMSLRPQAHDIIRTWAFDTILKAYLHNQEIPWKDIMISGHGLFKKGVKMSKTKNFVVKPLEVIEKFSADAMRYWAAHTSLGEDVFFEEKDLKNGIAFITKYWNAARFVENNLKDFKLTNEPKLKAEDKWILSRLNSLIEKATKALNNYEFSKALNPVRNFFWLEFCDYYLEEVKYRLYNKEKLGKENVYAAQWTLYHVLFNSTKLFAPFLPHVTEEVFDRIFKKETRKKSIHLSEWPKANEKMIKEYYEIAGELKNKIISNIRKLKSNNALPLNTTVKEVIIFLEDNSFLEMIQEMTEVIKNTCKIITFDLIIASAPSHAIEIDKGIKIVIEL